MADDVVGGNGRARWRECERLVCLCLVEGSAGRCGRRITAGGSQVLQLNGVGLRSAKACSAVLSEDVGDDESSCVGGVVTWTDSGWSYVVRRRDEGPSEIRPRCCSGAEPKAGTYKKRLAGSVDLECSLADDCRCLNCFVVPSSSSQRPTVGSQVRPD